MTQIEIDKSALAHNLNTIKKLAPGGNIVAVIKANAYGLGAIPIAKQLEKLGVNWLAVAYAQEGVDLRKAGVKAPIMVFYPQKENIPLLIEYTLQPALYSLDFSNSLATILIENKAAPYPVHIKCNTGLNRIGLTSEECMGLLSQKEKLPFAIQSIYSHLGSSEDSRPNAFSDSQVKQFSAIKEKTSALFDSPPMYHILNTSGAFNYPEYSFDCIRTGIGLYGFANQAQWDKQLTPVARLSTPIVQIHSVNTGESVGYNQGWVATQPTRIGVLPIGHADGISRKYGHGVGSVWINQQQAPIVGNVCMDMLMVDLTGIDCSVNDRAIIFDKTHTAESFAQKGDTIVYELLASLAARIPRIVH